MEENTKKATKNEKNHPQCLQACVNRTQFVRQITNNWRCGFIMSRKYKFELKRNAVEHYLNTNDS
ncbi:hypothetical protein, partial [Bacillus paranthracis]|uniref:hypothetical protein n=1 Tax=Bacillus paranthracis TaxID=2026186 RepID=UPI0024088AE2